MASSISNLWKPNITIKLDEKVEPRGAHDRKEKANGYLRRYLPKIEDVEAKGGHLSVERSIGNSEERESSSYKRRSCLKARLQERIPRERGMSKGWT